MRPIKQNVLQLVTAMPNLIENENELLHAYWVLFDDIQVPQDILKATPAGTISRRLRELQGEGKALRPQKQTEPAPEIVSEFHALA
ncbi:hypothetical protein [Paenibacillus xylanexedens]|uniref:hypothetical protein n=1 Tax=Paenibacillus xylanexedens TaxID=528191 RepID=UPI0011A4D9EE|nr:hypothetical protein [Paenibacillus xylanexedens]